MKLNFKNQFDSLHNTPNDGGDTSISRPSENLPTITIEDSDISNDGGDSLSTHLEQVSLYSELRSQHFQIIH